MFIAVKELEQHKLTISQRFAPGTIDFHTREFRQRGPLAADAVAELEGREIHLAGHLETDVELSCARCLESVTRTIASDFDVRYRPISTMARDEEIGVSEEDTDIGFYHGEGLFLADVLAEQVNLAIPIKSLCREECRGLCPECGANLNLGPCSCRRSGVDPRLAPLARWKLGRKES